MLKSINHGHVGPEQYDPLQMFDPGARCILGGIEAAFLRREIGRRQQLHRHGCYFGKFCAREPLLMIRKMSGRKNMKGMPYLVQQDLDIARQAYGVHEDEGISLDGKKGAVRAGRFAFAIVKVE